MSKAWHGRAGIELHRLGITLSDALQIPPQTNVWTSVGSKGRKFANPLCEGFLYQAFLI